VKRMWMVFIIQFWATSAVAADIEFQPRMTNKCFRILAKEAASVLLYRARGTRCPPWIIGFLHRRGSDGTQKFIKGEDYWRQCFQ